MADSVFTPAIFSVVLTPNPAEAGQPVLISVAAEDVEAFPSPAEYPCGLFPSGEV